MAANILKQMVKKKKPPICTPQSNPILTKDAEKHIMASQKLNTVAAELNHYKPKQSVLEF